MIAILSAAIICWLYRPGNNFVGRDGRIELDYCITGTQQCKRAVIFVDVSGPKTDCRCVGDCIWPGDTNADGVVDMSDLLVIGRYLGTNGEKRLVNSSTYDAKALR